MIEASRSRPTRAPTVHPPKHQSHVNEKWHSRPIFKTIFKPKLWYWLLGPPRSQHYINSVAESGFLSEYFFWRPVSKCRRGLWENVYYSMINMNYHPHVNIVLIFFLLWFFSHFSKTTHAWLEKITKDFMAWRSQLYSEILKYLELIPFAREKIHGHNLVQLVK